eukprot:g17358.t1
MGQGQRSQHADLVPGKKMRLREEEPTADGAQEAKNTAPVPEEPLKNPPPPTRRRDSFLDRYLSDELASRLRLAVSASDPYSQNNLRETEVDDEFDEMGSMLPDEEASCMEELLSEEDDDGLDDDGLDNGNEDSLDDEADANYEADVHDGNRETETEKTKPGAAPSLTLSPRPRPTPVGRSPGGVLEKARQCESHRGCSTMRAVSLSEAGAGMLNDAQLGTQSMKLKVTQLLAPPGSFPSGATAQPQRPASASSTSNHPPEAMLKSPRVSRRDPRFGHIEDALRSRPSEWVVGPNGPREKGQGRGPVAGERCRWRVFLLLRPHRLGEWSGEAYWEAYWGKARDTCPRAARK